LGIGRIGMRKCIAVLQILAIFLLVALAGCVPKNGSQEKGFVTLLISSDYGANRSLQKEIAYKKDMDILDVLTAAGAEAETAYGGGFVRKIGELASEAGSAGGTRKDWFYYVNGIFADVGLLDYSPQPGDHIWWDYHPWKMSQGIAAVIGAYPEPFAHGYRGKVRDTVIMYAEGRQEEAGEIQAKLTELGVKKVSVQEIDPLSLAEHTNPVIIIGEWRQLREYELLKDWNDNAGKNGAFLKFRDPGLELYDYSGKMVRLVEESAGVTAASGQGSGDECPIWFVAGTDYQGLSYALEILLEHPDKIQGFYQAVVLADEIIRLPLAEGS